MTPRLVLAACALLFWLGQNLALGLDFQRLQQELQTRFNGAGEAIFNDWQLLLGRIQGAPESERKKRATASKQICKSRLQINNPYTRL